MSSIPVNKKLILFDGVCNLCNNSIQYVIKHDKRNVFMFTPLQSKAAQSILSKNKVDYSKTDSILLYENGKGISIKSTAALKIAGSLRFPNPLMTIFYIIPPFIRDFLYDIIAKNRYRWFGKKDHCMVPTEDLKSKFI